MVYTRNYEWNLDHAVVIILSNKRQRIVLKRNYYAFYSDDENGSWFGHNINFYRPSRDYTDTCSEISIAIYYYCSDRRRYEKTNEL